VCRDESAPAFLFYVNSAILLAWVAWAIAAAAAASGAVTRTEVVSLWLLTFALCLFEQKREWTRATSIRTHTSERTAVAHS
jgi:hypothetical protein